MLSTSIMATFTASKTLSFESGIFELVHEACQRNYLVIVVTNQSGIARGMYTEQEFHALSDWMVAQFEQNGGSIHRVYHSPFHPVSGLGEFKKIRTAANRVPECYFPPVMNWISTCPNP